MVCTCVTSAPPNLSLIQPPTGRMSDNCRADPRVVQDAKARVNAAVRKVAEEVLEELGERTGEADEGPESQCRGTS